MHKSSPSRAIWRQASILALCLAASLALSAPGAAQDLYTPVDNQQQQTQSQTTLLYSASAYGTTAFVGSTIISDRTAPVGIGPGCGTARETGQQDGTVASVNVPPYVTTGVINTHAATSPLMATAHSDVHQVSLLAGLISGDEILAVSTTNKDNQGYHSSAAGSAFVNVVVAGTRYNTVPPPNTNINLVGLGKVVLNEQIGWKSGTASHLTVNMIHVYITVANNILNLPLGTQIIVADASSGLTEVSGPGALDGQAYGTQISGKIVKSSPTAPEYVPCTGTNGVVKTATVAGVNVPPVLSSGTITDTAKGITQAGLSSSTTTSSVQGLNLLNSVIKADVIQAAANASTTDGVTFNFTSTGSFLHLSVAGHSEIHDNVPENTVVPLAGFGTLYLHRVLHSGNDIEVRMIELVITQTNVLNLPLGTDIRVAVAEASLHSINHP